MIRRVSTWARFEAEAPEVAAWEFEIRGDRFNETAQLHWVHLVHPCGLSIGLVEHPDNPGAPFDERRSGLDHVSFAVAERRDIEGFARKIGELGHRVPQLIDGPNALPLVLRGPDNIQVEICHWKTAAPC